VNDRRQEIVSPVFEEGRFRRWKMEATLKNLGLLTCQELVG